MFFLLLRARQPLSRNIAALADWGQRGGARLFPQFGCSEGNGGESVTMLQYRFAVPAGRCGESNLLGALECITSSSLAAAAPDSPPQSMPLAPTSRPW